MPLHGGLKGSGGRRNNVVGSVLESATDIHKLQLRTDMVFIGVR